MASLASRHLVSARRISGIERYVRTDGRRTVRTSNRPEPCLLCLHHHHRRPTCMPTMVNTEHRPYHLARDSSQFVSYRAQSKLHLQLALQMRPPHQDLDGACRTVGIGRCARTEDRCNWDKSNPLPWIPQICIVARPRSENRQRRRR